MGGWRMAHGLTHPHTTTFLDAATLAQHDDLVLDELRVATSDWGGRTLGAVHVRREHGVLVAAVRRADGTLAPTPDADAVLHEGDVMIVIGAPERVRKLRSTLAG